MENSTFNTSQARIGYNVTRLKPHTEYEFEVTPINPGGAGETSAKNIITDQASKSNQ